MPPRRSAASVSSKSPRERGEWEPKAAARERGEW